MWTLAKLLCAVLLASRTFGAQIPDNFLDDEVQYEVEPPQDIRVQCNSNEIMVNVDTVHNVFNGMIYPMGLSKNSSCMAEFSQTTGPVRYRLPLRSCNTMSTQLVRFFKSFLSIITGCPETAAGTCKHSPNATCRRQPV